MHASVWKLAPDLGGQRRQLGDRIDHALRVLRRAADDQHRVRSDERRHGVDVGAPVVAHRHLVQPDAEVVGRLVERRVGAGRHHHLRLGDAALLAAALAGRLHRAEDALGAARGHEARRRRRRRGAGRR